MVLEKTLESSLGRKEIKPVNAKGNQTWIFIGRADLKLKPQYFNHQMQRPDSLEKTLMLGKTEGRRRRCRGWDDWIALPIQWTRIWANSWRRKWHPTPVFLPGESHGRGAWWASEVHAVAQSWIRLSDWHFHFHQEIVKDRRFWRAVVHGVAKGHSWLRDWTRTTSATTTLPSFL